jgi:hypothetical protein
VHSSDVLLSRAVRNGGALSELVGGGITDPVGVRPANADVPEGSSMPIPREPPLLYVGKANLP